MYAVRNEIRQGEEGTREEGEKEKARGEKKRREEAGSRCAVARRGVARGNRISRKQPPRQRPKIEGAYGGRCGQCSSERAGSYAERPRGKKEDEKEAAGGGGRRRDTEERAGRGGRRTQRRRGKGERERERERGGNEKERRSARTILINPVPGSRSRSNRVHDLQGIYIRSSTRGYNSIPSFYSALSAGLKP